MLEAGSLASLLVVSLLWGMSTPFLRKGSEGIEKIRHKNFFKQWFAELWFLATRWKYALPFLVNQSGSAFYIMTLASTDLSLAIPLTNSLTFVFVTLVGRYLGEEGDNVISYIGMILVITGVTLCVADRVQTSIK